VQLDRSEPVRAHTGVEPTRLAHPAAGERDLEHRAITAAKHGDWDALHYLYVRYADDVQRLVNGIVRDSHEAEDITQDVFAKLVKAIKKYEEREVPFAAWISRVARNAALDNLRAKRQIPVAEVRTSDHGLDRSSHERLQSLKEALASLPPAQRQVLMLRHIKGLSPNEIAERLGKTESSIQGLHHRGRGALKAALTERGAAPVTATEQIALS
jgi:RNA polymerase sigma-70 factor (ECF subfamily)